MGDSERGKPSSLWLGIAYCVVVAAVSFFTWFLYKPVSSLMWSFIYSIVFANTVGIRGRLLPGVDYCSSKLLEGTIAALGIVTSALIWVQVGVGVINSIAIIIFSFSFSIWLGKRMGLSYRLATLIGVGTSICGASAIAATAPAIGAKEEEVGLAIAGITLFGLISMFLYPFLFVNTHVNGWLMKNLNCYAIWVGSGVHETAQVIAAAGALGPEVIRPALLIKSVRIFMIGPIILIATYLFRRFEEKAAGKSHKSVVPTFGIMFILNSILCTIIDAYANQLYVLGVDWESIKAVLSGTILPFLLATAFAGVGSTVKFQSITTLGAKPFAMAALMAILTGILALVLAGIVSPFISPMFLI